MRFWRIEHLFTKEFRALLLYKYLQLSMQLQGLLSFPSRFTKNILYPKTPTICMPQKDM